MRAIEENTVSFIMLVSGYQLWLKKKKRKTKKKKLYPGNFFVSHFTQYFIHPHVHGDLSYPKITLKNILRPAVVAHDCNYNTLEGHSEKIA